MMTFEEFRSEMTAYQESVVRQGTLLKDPVYAQERLCALYRKFDPSERKMAEEVLREWSLSESEDVRFDALALVREFSVISVIPSLQELAKRLVRMSGPGAPYELKKVNRLIEELEK